MFDLRLEKTEVRKIIVAHTYVYVNQHSIYAKNVSPEEVIRNSKSVVTLALLLPFVAEEKWPSKFSKNISLHLIKNLVQIFYYSTLPSCKCISSIFLCSF